MLIVCRCGEGQHKKRIHDTYYLPGDIKRIFYPYDMEQLNEVWKSIRVFMEQFMRNMQPVLENVAKTLREMAKFSPFEEHISIKDVIKELEEKYLLREPLPRPSRIIKAVNLNKRVKKIIYYHVRSNC